MRISRETPGWRVRRRPPRDLGPVVVEQRSQQHSECWLVVVARIEGWRCTVGVALVVVDSVARMQRNPELK